MSSTFAAIKTGASKPVETILEKPKVEDDKTKNTSPVKSSEEHE